MAIPKINSAHGSETRNIINRAIDLINVQGKSIQDLVAEGQLTPEQYAELVSIVNGNVKKGSITTADIDKNNFLVDQTMITDGLRSIITGNAPINAVPADKSITTQKIADKAVTPKVTSFFTKSRNKFEGEYLPWTILSDTNGWYIQDETNGYDGSLAIVEIAPNTQCSIKIHEPELSNRFKIGVSANYPTFTSKKFYLNSVVNTNDALKEYTFTSGATDKYLFVYVSNESKKPLMQVEFGAKPTEYIKPIVIPESEIDDNIVKNIITEIKSSQNTVTILEDAFNGYPSRPNAISVIWIGKNEPTDIEPLDEWRETEGFLYYTDFSNLATPSEWSKKWYQGGELSIVTHNGLPALKISQSGDGRFSAKWEVLNQDVDIVDSEVYLLGNPNSFTTGVVLLGTVHRGSGAFGSEKGYTFSVRTNLGLVASKTVNGTSVNLVNVTLTDFDFSKPIHIRSRVVGNRLSAKVWQEGDVEPNAWMIDTVDNVDTITDSGFCGIYKFAPNTAYIYKFSVGTSGMRSPKRKLI